MVNELVRFDQDVKGGYIGCRFCVFKVEFLDGIVKIL